MEKANEILEKTKIAILADAISFVTIIDVVSNVNFEGDILLYVKTSDLGTVEIDGLKNLEDKYSTKQIGVRILVPKSKFIEGKHIENKDSVNIFIQEK
jgi:hypothetical protein